MTKHRTPAAGYVSDAKQDYREKVWAAFKASGAIHRAVTDNQFILILPGLQCDEIETAIRYGCPPDRIICVHESAAHVATGAEWRKRWPDMPFYCCKVSEVGKKLQRDRVLLCAANLSFCNNLSLELLGELNGFVKSTPLTVSHVLAITVAKGRESSITVAMMEHLAQSSSKFTEKRLCALDAMVFSGADMMVLTEGSYLHSRTPMAFCVIWDCSPAARIKRAKEQGLLDRLLILHATTVRMIYKKERNATIRLNRIYQAIRHLDEAKVKNHTLARIINAILAIDENQRGLTDSILSNMAEIEKLTTLLNLTYSRTTLGGSYKILSDLGMLDASVDDMTRRFLRCAPNKVHRYEGILGDRVVRSITKAALVLQF